MKTLLLMRHSYAASNNPAWSDRERPLTQYGRELADRTGPLLSEFLIQRIVCSSATRTAETAEIISHGCSVPPVLTAVDSLYLAPSSAYGSAAAEFATPEEKTVLIIGHNPGISELANQWSDESLAFTPGCVAIFQRIENDWQVSTRVDSRFVLQGFVSEGERLW